MRNFSKRLIILAIAFLPTTSQAAVAHLLGDTFFPNPADLNRVQKLEVATGMIAISPRLEFKGTKTIINNVPVTTSGTAKTQGVTDFLPYVKVASRINDKWVVGLDVSPRTYGHVLWELDSFVNSQGTETFLSDYLVSGKVSYQVNDKLAVGFAAILARSIQQLDARANLGTDAHILHNKFSAWDPSFTIGANYMFTPSMFGTAVYTHGVGNTADGKSSFGTTVNRKYSNKATEPKIMMLGLGKFFSPKFVGMAKIYWTNWATFNKLDFKNTANPNPNFTNFAPATKYKNTLTFELSGRYQFCEDKAVIAAVVYDTKPVNAATNSIGYPSSTYAAAMLGLDWNITKSFIATSYYGYGTFVNKAKIDNSPALPVSYKGEVSADIHMAGLQFSYKI